MVLSPGNMANKNKRRLNQTRSTHHEKPTENEENVDRAWHFARVNTTLTHIPTGIRTTTSHNIWTSRQLASCLLLEKSIVERDGFITHNSVLVPIFIFILILWYMYFSIKRKITTTLLVGNELLLLEYLREKKIECRTNSLGGTTFDWTTRTVTVLGFQEVICSYPILSTLDYRAILFLSLATKKYC